MQNFNIRGNNLFIVEIKHIYLILGKCHTFLTQSYYLKLEMDIGKNNDVKKVKYFTELKLSFSKISLIKSFFLLNSTSRSVPNVGFLHTSIILLKHFILQIYLQLKSCQISEALFSFIECLQYIFAYTTNVSQRQQAELKIYKIIPFRPLS